MSTNRSRPADAAAIRKVVAEAFPDSRVDTVAVLADAGRLVRFAPGETIIDQGDTGSLVLVLDGHIGLRRTTVDGRQLMTRIATRGELAVFLPLADRPVAAEMIALSACTVVVWWSSQARALAAHDAGLAIALMDHILASVETLVERVDGLLHQDASREWRACCTPTRISSSPSRPS